MKFFQQRQMQRLIAGAAPDLGQHFLHPRFVRCGDDKPQVVVMFALVVVVDLGIGADQLRHFIEFLRRDGECGKRAGANAVRPEYRAHTAHFPASLKPGQRFQHLGFADAQPPGDHAKRSRHQREIALEIVEQMMFEVGHFPAITARCGARGG